MSVNCVTQSKCCRALGKRESVLLTVVVKGGLMVKAGKIGTIWIH